ncbi:MAG: helix-turn-helix transcriptional regulator [Clostridiales bacterium]|nr:helix-turn-helix transcriptional regulator [Clostridiales bacterium]
MKNRLEELRRARGVRQEDVAQALGVSRQTVISLEKGKYNPSLALAFRLSRFFGLPIEEIFDDSDERAEEAGKR